MAGNTLVIDERYTGIANINQHSRKNDSIFQAVKSVERLTAIADSCTQAFDKIQKSFPSFIKFDAEDALKAGMQYGDALKKGFAIGISGLSIPPVQIPVIQNNVTLPPQNQARLQEQIKSLQPQNQEKKFNVWDATNNINIGVSKAKKVKNGVNQIKNSEKMGLLSIALGAGNLPGNASLGASTLSLLGAGSVVGRGVGGIAALTRGDEIGKKLSDPFDSSMKIAKTTQNLKDTTNQFDRLSSKATEVSRLTERYKELDQKIKDGKLSAQELANTKLEQTIVVSQINKTQSDIQITEQDQNNGNAINKMESITQMSREEMIQTRKIAEDAVNKGNKNLPHIIKNIEDSKDAYANADAENSKFRTWRTNALVIENKIRDFDSKNLNPISNEYKEKTQNIQEMVNGLNKETGQMFTMDDFRNDNLSQRPSTQWEIDMKNASNNRGKARLLNAEAQEQYRTQYNSEIYLDKLHLMDDGSILNVDEVLQKVNQVQANNAEISRLKKLKNSSMQDSKTMKEYQDQINTKENQEKILKGELNQYNDSMIEVIQRIAGVNQKFDMIHPNEQYHVGALATYFGVNANLPKYQTGKEYLSQASVQNQQQSVAGEQPQGQTTGQIQSMRVAQFTAENTAPVTVNNTNTVNLGGLNMTVNGAGNDKEILSVIQREMPILTNQLCTVMANQLSKVYGNMPITAQA